MASNSSIIACGSRMTMVAMGLKFLVGPALMAVASIVIGLRDTTLKVAIVQVIFLFFSLLLFRLL
jgi:auxin efflux carrier family